MREIGIGLIGCGGRLRDVLDKTLKYSDRFKVRAVCDPDERSVRATREAYGSRIVVHEQARDLAARPDVDWVMIGSWNCLHREHAVAAFEAGKHVFCEKPLATTLEDCLVMREAWKKSGRRFVIGFTLRYSPHYKKIKELVVSGHIGYLISMEFNETLDFNHGGYIHGDWRRLTALAGTHLLEKCCHDIDLANWIVDSRARRVASFGGLNFFTPSNAHHIERLGRNDKRREAYRTWPGLVEKNPFTADKDIVDNQVAVIEYENDVRATFHTNCNTAIPERRMYLCGSEGTLRANVLSGEIELKRIGFNEQTIRPDTGGRGGHGGGDDVLGESLADCMLGNASPRTSLDDGFNAAITCFAIDRAMYTGQVVSVADCG